MHSGEIRRFQGLPLMSLLDLAEKQIKMCVRVCVRGGGGSEAAPGHMFVILNFCQDRRVWNTFGALASFQGNVWAF